VTVINRTTAVAHSTIASKAALAQRSVRVVTPLTGAAAEDLNLENAFTVLPVSPPEAFANNVQKF